MIHNLFIYLFNKNYIMRDSVDEQISRKLLRSLEHESGKFLMRILKKYYYTTCMKNDYGLNYLLLFILIFENFACKDTKVM